MAWTYGTPKHTLLFFVTAAICVMSEPLTTCTVDPVVIGRPTVMICSFKDDMQIDRLPIVAYHTKINSTEKGKIANCLWREKDSRYKCDLRKGLLLVGEVSDKLRLKIEKADEDAQGEYICQKSPSKPSDSTGCTLTLSDTPVVSTSAEIPTNDAITNGTDDNPGVNVPAIAISVAVVGLGGVLIAGFLVVCKRRQENVKKTGVKGEKNGGMETLVGRTESSKDGEENREK